MFVICTLFAVLRVHEHWWPQIKAIRVGVVVYKKHCTNVPLSRVEYLRVLRNYIFHPQHIDPKILPEDLGGSAGPFDNSMCVAALKLMPEHFVNVQKFVEWAKANKSFVKKSQNWNWVKMFSNENCGTVGRVAASNTGRPVFKSSHHPFL